MNWPPGSSQTACLFANLDSEDDLMRRPLKSGTLQLGDQLEKISFPGSVWIVLRLIESRHQRPHAVIAYQKNSSETRMLAVSTLLDKGFYRRVEAHLVPVL